MNRVTNYKGFQIVSGDGNYMIVSPEFRILGYKKKLKDAKTSIDYYVRSLENCGIKK